MKISKAEIRTILRIAAVRDFPPWQDTYGNPKPAEPGKILQPGMLGDMTDEEREGYKRLIEKAIKEYFQRVKIDDAKAQQYYDQVVEYLMGEAEEKPRIKNVMPSTSEVPSARVKRPAPKRRRPPMDIGPGGRMPVPSRRRIFPDASTGWYEVAKSS